jgi:predicted NAD-dependent protein-ADP-ribosyltransferase YbiA (DUF1768 family)
MSEKEEKNKDELVGVEREIDEVQKQLKEAIQEWRDGGKISDVLKAQRDLARLDSQLTALRSPLRWVKEFKNLATRDILLDEFYEVRKIGYPVSALRMRSLAPEDMVRIGSLTPTPSPSPSLLPDEEEEEAEVEEEPSVVFFDPADPDHGYLSPDTLVDFVYNSTKYNCATQAYEVERVTMLGRKDLRPLLLKTRSPRTVRMMGQKVVGEVENAKELWINILKALASQDEKTREVLEATGEDRLIYADSRNSKLGVGLPANDPNILDRSAWTGENWLGLAWEAVRASASAGAEAPTFTEEAKTTEQAKKQRGGVLSNMYKRR